MKPTSKTSLFLLLLFSLMGSRSFASTNSDFFKPVPANDPTYAQLQQLEDSGLLPQGASQKELTRYEVAKLIWKARENYKQIVVASSDMTLPPSTASMDSGSSDDEFAPPPPPSEGIMADKTAAASGPPPPAAPTPKPTPDYVHHPELLAAAEANLNSLEQAYQLELDAVLQAKGSMLDHLAKAESDQYDLWRGVKSLTESPSFSIHGIGRMFGIFQDYYATYNLGLSNPTHQYMSGYLDLAPQGSITKQIQWGGILRLGTSGLPLNGVFEYPNLGFDLINFRKITLNFSPDFMTATVGDFFESYTPFTIWNRNNLDLFYKPEPMARWDDEYKYESFFNNEPDWPFRGLRIGTALGWPDSDLLDQFKVSGFGHMIRDGFNDGPNGGTQFPTNENPQIQSTFLTNAFTDFIFGGESELKLRKWFLGDTSWQFSAQAYGVILDELFNQNLPISEYAYSKYNPNSWAHQYRITSIRPLLTVGLGGDVYVGAQYEGSFAAYQDDKTNQARTISDYALRASPFFQFENSKITFDYMDVGPYFYSPLAQTRQDDITSPGGTLTSTATIPNAMAGSGLFTAPLQGQYFLIDVPRANAIYGFYDRTQDNVFPYGLATPNRQGGGFELDVKALPDQSLKIAGAAYFLSEITGNLVVDKAGTGYTGVDELSNGLIPQRKFTYINVGPSFDFGPSLGLKTPIELGTNLRYEQTNSVVGTLTDDWILGGIKVGLFPWWEVSAAYGVQTMNGSDMGYGGGTYARYSYVYNNQDLGSYSVFTVNGTIQDLMWSTTFNLDGHSKLHFDYSFAYGNEGLNSAPAQTLYNQYMELTYEVKF